MLKSIVVVSLILLIVAIVLLLGPALLLWAVGTLAQGEGLDFTFWNWLAALVILMLVNGGSASKNRS